LRPNVVQRGVFMKTSSWTFFNRNICCLTLILGILLILIGTAYGDSSATPLKLNASKGSESTLGRYLGQKDSDLYFEPMRKSWDIQKPDCSTSKGSGIWKVSMETKEVTFVSDAEFRKTQSSLRTWDSELPQGKPVTFKMDHGAVWVGNAKLFQVPNWVDGKGKSLTQVGVREYPGVRGEKVYCVRYITLPKKAIPIHDYSASQMVFVKDGKVHSVSSGMAQPQVIVPAKGGGYLCYGYYPSSGVTTAFAITASDKWIGLDERLKKNLKIPDSGTVQLLGIRNGSALYAVPGEENTWQTGLYGINAQGTVRKCKESLQNVRDISESPNLALGADGTLYHIGSAGEMLFDLTHQRSVDLMEGLNTVGNYCPLGVKTLKLTKTGTTVRLPSYFYKGAVCCCIEDFEGRGLLKKWDTKRMEARFSPAPVKVKERPEVLEHGPAYRSDVVILLDGNPMPSVNIGGRSLVSIDSLKDNKLIQ